MRSDIIQELIVYVTIIFLTGCLLAICTYKKVTEEMQKLLKKK